MSGSSWIAKSKVGDGVLVFTQAGLGNAAGDVSPGIVGLYTERNIKVGDGDLVLTQVEPTDAAIVVADDILRLQTDNLVEVSNGVLV